MQENVYAADERSTQGTKFVYKNGTIHWLIKKKDIDLACRDKNFDENLTVNSQLIIKLYFNFLQFIFPFYR
jgi:hypothetical protein